MHYLHLVTGQFSLANSVAAVAPEPGDTHAVVLLYQSQPAAIDLFHAAVGRLLPGAPVVVMAEPGHYRTRLAQRGFFADRFADPDRIVAFHTHSIPEHEAILAGFPDATLTLVDEGAASYYPNLVGRHLDVDRIDGVHLHDYLDVFHGHETTGYADKLRRIDPDRFRRVLETMSTLPAGTGSPKRYRDRPVVVLAEQYFFQKRGVDITINQQAHVYADAIARIVAAGYAVEYRRHPREANRLFEHTLGRVDAALREWVDLDTRSVALSEFDFVAGNRPAAIVGISSTSMLTGPHFFGVPAFRIQTDLPLRLAKAAPAESAGLVNNHSRFAVAVPPLATLPPATRADDAPAVFRTHLESAHARGAMLRGALFPEPELAASVVDDIRVAIGPTIDTVSFDAFDTLVVRKGTVTTDLLTLGDRRAFDEGLLPPGLRFSAVRKGAPPRMRATADRALADKPEYTLDDIYGYIRTALSLSAEDAARLRALEVDLEVRHNVSRRFGSALLALAKLHGKRTIIVSDTFFDRGEFARIVCDKLAVQPDEIYLSSQQQATKSSGALFARVLQAETVTPKRLLHIGDSPRSDVENPRKLGITALHVPGVYEEFFERSALGKRLAKERSKRAFSLTWSVVARRFFDAPGGRAAPNALSRSDPYFLGYAIVGPAFLHWTLWIMREAERRGFDELAFLARDGALPLRIFELVKTVWPTRLEGRYVYASRALAVNVLSAHPGLIAYNEEVHGYGRLNTPEQVLRTRFGQPSLDALRPFFAEYGLGDGTRALEDDLMPFRALLADKAHLVAQLKRDDAEATAGYYRALFDDVTSVAVVDFGYSGSSQRAISAALGRGIGGFYFTRKENNIDYSDSMSLDTSALSDSPTFLDNGGFIEFLTTPDHLRSIVGFTKTDGELSPVFAERVEEIPELRRLQRGIIDFAQAYIDDFGEEVAHITCRAELATHALAGFLNRPLSGDLALFEKMGHHDALGADRGFALDYWRAGRDHRERTGGADRTAAVKTRIRRRLGRVKRGLRRRLSRLLE